MGFMGGQVSGAISRYRPPVLGQIGGLRRPQRSRSSPAIRPFSVEPIGRVNWRAPSRRPNATIRSDWIKIGHSSESIHTESARYLYSLS